MAAPTAVEALLQLVNTDNNTTFDFTQISFNPPIVSTENNRNTKVEVLPVTGSGLTGQKDVYYNRLSLNLLDTTGIEFAHDAVITISDIVTELNIKNGLAITPLDYLNANQVVTVDEGTTDNVTITAHSDSYAWIESVVVPVKRNVETFPLGNQINNPLLDGLNFNDLTNI